MILSVAVHLVAPGAVCAFEAKARLAGIQTTQRYLQKGYAITNAQINWTDPRDHYTLCLYADNFTNTRYNFELSGSAFGDYSQGNEPATYGVRVGAKF